MNISLLTVDGYIDLVFENDTCFLLGPEGKQRITSLSASSLTRRKTLLQCEGCQLLIAGKSLFKLSEKWCGEIDRLQYDAEEPVLFWFNDHAYLTCFQRGCLTLFKFQNKLTPLYTRECCGVNLITLVFPYRTYILVQNRKYIVVYALYKSERFAQLHSLYLIHEEDFWIKLGQNGAYFLFFYSEKKTIECFLFEEKKISKVQTPGITGDINPVSEWRVNGKLRGVKIGQDAFYAKGKQILRRDAKILEGERPEVCPVCLSDERTVFVLPLCEEPQHAVCAVCWEEMKKAGNRKCPLCRQ